jgi:thioredoxin reductase (NADPH)
MQKEVFAISLKPSMLCACSIQGTMATGSHASTHDFRGMLRRSFGKRVMSQSTNSQDPLIVAVMCAAWCRTCTEFRPAMDALAAQRPQMRFVWIDIEDDSDLCGDLDIEDFPTLAVFRGNAPLHFGPSLPLENLVGRLLDELATREVNDSAEWPKALQALAMALDARETRPSP